jgi:ABC-type transport system involved in cytochrome c biogenesis permease component
MGGLSLWHWLVLVIILPISFAPTIVAFVRKHNQKWLVFLLNLLTGWTWIGWIAALIWAIAGKPVAREESFEETFR